MRDIFLEKYNKFLYAAFDILYYKNKDVREVEELKERHKYLLDVINNIDLNLILKVIMKILILIK